MAKILSDYLKCVVANKFTLAGYISLGTLIGGLILNNFFSEEINEILNGLSRSEYGSLFKKSLGFCLLASSVFNLSITGVGLDTLTTYEKTRNHINNHGNEVDKRFREKFMEGYYCDKEGYNLAVREANLEELVI